MKQEVLEVAQGEEAAQEVLEVGSGGLVAANVADMRTWLALQAFLAALLPGVGAAAFRRWAHTFTLQLVRGAGPPSRRTLCIETIVVCTTYLFHPISLIFSLNLIRLKS